MRGDAIGAHTLEIGTKTKSLSMVLGVAFFDVEERKVYVQVCVVVRLAEEGK